MVRLGVVVCLACLVGEASAQRRGEAPSLQTMLREADEMFRADQLIRAEELYRRALAATSGGEDRRLCYDRLLAIYVRAGRQDEAVQTGLRYQDWLRETGQSRRARELSVDLGGWYLALGHYGPAEEHLERALVEPPKEPLPPARKLFAWTYRAVAAEKLGDREGARRAWREVETVARESLDRPRMDLDPREQIDAVRNLAESYRFQKRYADAIDRLAKLLAVHDELKDPRGKRDTLRLLAGQLAAAGRLADAEARLKEALELHAAADAADRHSHADLTADLADVLDKEKRGPEADKRRAEAVAEYNAVLKDHLAGRRTEPGALAVFWKLQALYQRARLYDAALDLARDVADYGSGGFLIESRLKTEQGSVGVVRGLFEQSRAPLLDAVKELRGRKTLNLSELPRALLNLAVVDLALDRREEAERIGQECLGLYREHGLPDDLILVEAYNLLGTCAAQDADYSRAVDHFREGVRRCRTIGPAADPSLNNLLLNLALLHRSQGDLDAALATCRQAREVFSRFADKDALGFAALDAALAGLLATRAQIDEAYALTPEILRVCALHDHRGPLLIAARHCQGLYFLHHREFDKAEQAWNEVRRLAGPNSPLLPRTLNYLALIRECQGKLADAEELYEEARRRQERSPRAFPATQFNTLWRLANVLDARGRKAEARSRLEQAVAVVEKARLRTYGDAQQRAAFFAQFAPAFEQLVEWSLRDGDVEGAVAASARGRSRTLLDQLLLAGVDPRAGLPADRAEELRRREEAARRELAELRGRALLIPEDARDAPKARELLEKYDRAQQEYSDASREILNANPVYHSLSRPEITREELASLRDKALGPRKALLVYHVGRERSFLLLLGDSSRKPEAFPLTVPADVAERAAPPEPGALDESLVRPRGLRLLARLLPDYFRPLVDAAARARAIRLRPPATQPELPAPAAREGPTAPLSQSVLRALVESYLEQASDPEFSPSRGIRLRSSDSGRPLPDQRPELLADVVLPPAARKRIREWKPETLVVVPDGALHKLPFEALVLKAGAEPTYVLDQMPPLVYAPSAAILSLLTERAPAAPGPLSLLTVADPDYGAARGRKQGQDASDDFALHSQLPRLPFTSGESRKIAAVFQENKFAVESLTGKRATEKALTAALGGKRVVHIAAHGLADDRFGNKFGALALTPPPGKATADDDGFLSLYEIYTLPLKNCELAVLSACDTHVGPQQPLEAGVTLSSGFLAAGARRVVASHWSVDDESTAELMVAFFNEVTSAAKKSERVSYAQALQQARKEVRKVGRWSSPHFWAPFVLVGPAD
jgi:CHAT domain-containing protein/TolA-binding protein